MKDQDSKKPPQPADSDDKFVIPDVVLRDFGGNQRMMDYFKRIERKEKELAT